MHFLFGNYYQFSLFWGGVIALISSFAVYYDGPRESENIGWFLSNIFAAIWSFGYLNMITTQDKEIASLSNIILHWAAIFIPLFYFFFTLAITKSYERYKKVFYFFSILAIFFTVIVTLKSFVLDVVPKFIFNYVPDAGPLYKYFTAYFFIVVIYALVILYKNLDVTEISGLDKLRLKYIFIASMLGFAGGSSVFFLTFNIQIPPFSIVTFSLYPIVITYAILRHHLFNVRVIATELFIFALWMFILIRTLAAQNSQEQLSNGVLLIATIVIGILLIRNVWKEVRTREEMEALTEQLAAANEKLKELDQAKTEFISIASHQLRTPLTAIKGYASLILEGDYGEISADLKHASQIIFDSANTLVTVVADYLNVSSIELGKMKYDFTVFDLKDLVKSVIEELKQNIEKIGLELKFECDVTKSYSVKADLDKLKQVLVNIIDNSAKYTPKGGITVSLTKNSQAKVLFAVKDTGIGISKETIPKLFAKFIRAKNANETNMRGTGLGLFIAKEIINAHSGRIWVESEGEGEGSQFYVELNETNF